MNSNYDEKICNMDFDTSGLEASDLENIARIEQSIQQFANSDSVANLLSVTIRIPVVVHVVHNTEAQNISDAQVISQIEALNSDFRKLNRDLENVPQPFLPFVADTNIEFALAVRDPNGNSTNGITRTLTSEIQFIEPHGDPLGHKNQPIKHSDQGGHDPWPTDKYLNIWVCNLRYHNNDTGTLELASGYSQFPGGEAKHDGVVINYDSFGTVGDRRPHRQLGRTATHEIGHWLSLKHLWGKAGGCTGNDDDDDVSDTPHQKGRNSRCPTFPSTEQCCKDTGTNGTMFMNYLDLTDDECMCMFTLGQAVRMRATLNTARRHILSSDGLTPVTTFAE
jgi:hypothetical protein